jgi:hypothetical protein
LCPHPAECQSFLARCSAERHASAIKVSVGFFSGLFTNTLASATWMRGISCNAPVASHMLVFGSVPILHVPA